MALISIDAQTPLPYPDYQMSVHDVVGREYLARWQRELSRSAFGTTDVAVAILPDGTISALQVLRNTAPDADLALVIAAIKHAKIPAPPADSLKNGVFQMIIHVGLPEKT